MSLPIAKSFNRPLSLIAALLLTHIGGAMAADSTGDVEKQTREVLAGKIANQSALPSEGRDGRVVTPNVDAQEFARRLLLGVTDSRVQATQAVTQPVNAVAPGDSTSKKGLLVHGDSQAIAQKLLLGQRS